MNQINNRYTLREYINKLLQSEREAYFIIIDIIAHEYHWSVEYIQNLTLPEIKGIITTIRKRKDIEDQIQQINVAKAMSGKLSSNLPVQKDSKVEERKAENEVANLNQLARLLKTKVVQVPIEEEDGKGK